MLSFEIQNLGAFIVHGVECFQKAVRHFSFPLVKLFSVLFDLVDRVQFKTREVFRIEYLTEHMWEAAPVFECLYCLVAFKLI